MKYVLFLVALFFLEGTFAQTIGLDLHHGDTVLWRITQYQMGSGRYDPAAPLFIVGRIKSFHKGTVRITPHYYLYACSATSEQWVKSTRVEIEKQSMERKKEGDTVWTIEEALHRNRNKEHVRPWTPEAEQALTRRQYVPTAQCPKVVLVNLTANYRR